MTLTPTTHQAVSRFLRANGHAAAMWNKGVTCHTGPRGTVTVYIYPGDPQRMVDVLNSAGYEASTGYRSVSVKGRCR